MSDKIFSKFYQHKRKMYNKLSLFPGTNTIGDDYSKGLNCLN